MTVVSKEANIIHKKVGRIFQEIVSKYPNLKLLRDPACEGKQRIPLFFKPVKSRENEFCNVDMMVLKEDKIKLIVEIEESNVKPTQVCGKFLTSALAKYYIHYSGENKPIEMDENVTFLQILDASKLVKEKTKKIIQWKQLETSINNVLPLKNSRIRTYRILTTGELSELNKIILAA
ncbi:MAG: hypothetical protein ABSF44_06785 [Candidatus Bathyarchaeia archaeon]|jgi:hypothetical protein